MADAAEQAFPNGAVPKTAPVERHRVRRPRANRPIEVRVRSVMQLFDSLDPSPFIERDIDPDAEAFMVSWAREFSRRVPLRLRIIIQEQPPFDDYRERVSVGIHNYFTYREEMTRRELHQLLRRGRKSLIIGLSFLAGCLLLADALAGFSFARFSSIVHESLVIGGWVAMWTPLQIFLYGWWPIRDELSLNRRLAGMPIEFVEGWKGEASHHPHMSHGSTP